MLRIERVSSLHTVPLPYNAPKQKPNVTLPIHQYLLHMVEIERDSLGLYILHIQHLQTLRHAYQAENIQDSLPLVRCILKKAINSNGFVVDCVWEKEKNSLTVFFRYQLHEAAGIRVELRFLTHKFRRSDGDCVVREYNRVN